jgi:hypothetical protein
MSHFPKYLTLLILTLTLSACDRQDVETSPAAETESSAQQPAPAVGSEPADAPPAPLDRDPALASESTDLTQARAERQLIREQRESDSGWWDDEALSQRLGLEPEQRAALLDARRALHSARLDANTRLREQRSALGSTPDRGDADRLNELRETREAIENDIAAAEQLWQTAAGNILNRDQLERLRAQYPEALDSPPGD